MLTIDPRDLVAAMERDKQTAKVIRSIGKATMMRFTRPS